MKAFFAVAGFLFSTLVSSIAAEKPNIVLIFADDLGWGELGCYGQTKIKTPHLDQLAAAGMRFTNFYSGSPVCSPSRNVLLTGRHGGGCDIQDLKRVDPKEKNTGDGLRGDWPLSGEAYLLPAALKKAGYATAAFGKWGLGNFGTTGAPDKHGIQEFFGYTDQRACHSFYPKFLWHNGEKVPLNDPEIPGHARVAGPEVDDKQFTGQQHASQAIVEKMLSWVDEAARREQPFFLYYTPLEPHVALQPPAEWVKRYPEDWDQKPYLGERGYTPHSRPRAAYAAMISYLDYNVGQLIARLRATGKWENTLVIFSSDNGTTHDAGGVDHKFFNSVKGLRGWKGQMYEGGIRVPGIISWPGKIPAGTASDQPSYVADVMPTLCSIVGADPGQPYGENMEKVWLGKTRNLPDRKPLVWCTGGYGGQLAVRIGDYKILRGNLLKGAPDKWEIYNLSLDPGEKNNIAAQHPDLITRTKKILDEEYRPARGFPALPYQQ